MKQTALLLALFTLLLCGHAKAQGPYSNVLWGYGNSLGSLGYSAAGGYQNNAHGFGSFASGYQSYTPGEWSFARGVLNQGVGNYATALGGTSNTANGLGSFASGYQSVAAGDWSFAMGLGAYSQSAFSFSLGTWPVIRGNPTATVTTDPVFTVGNGGGPTARSNAMVVLKNGAVLIKPAGDLSMGTFTAGIKPDDTTP